VARFYYIQYHCHVQLCEAIQYARGKGISVKGDIPIGIYRFSVDAWMYPQLFDQSQQVPCFHLWPARRKWMQNCDHFVLFWVFEEPK
jgi:4-alpha-glucanotransferase